MTATALLWVLTPKRVVYVAVVAWAILWFVLGLVVGHGLTLFGVW